MPTTISWAAEVWNPTTGCDRASRGCDNCYAMKLAPRLKAMEAKRIDLGTLTPDRAKYQTDGDPRTSGPGFGVATHEDTLAQPLKWRQPRRIFVNSMSDLFHPKIPDGFIARVWDVMGRCPHHKFLILTKRPKRMRSWVNTWADRTGDAQTPGNHGLPPGPRGPEAMRATYTSGRARLFADMLADMGEPPEGCAYPTYDWMEGQRWWPRVLPNVWLGVSIEDQHNADQRLGDLDNTEAAVRWISAEPLLGPLDLSGRLQSTHWVVLGGESLGGRPMDADWARQVRDQCAAAGVAFFFKQTGTALARQLGIDGKGEAFEQLPAEFQIRQYPARAPWLVDIPLPDGVL